MSAHSTPRRELAKQSFDNIIRYNSDPVFAAQCAEEGERLNAASMAKMDAGIARYWAKRRDVALSGASA